MSLKLVARNYASGANLKSTYAMYLDNDQQICNSIWTHKDIWSNFVWDWESLNAVCLLAMRRALSAK